MVKLDMNAIRELSVAERLAAHDIDPSTGDVGRRPIQPCRRLEPKHTLG
jgi:hypothetical protein